jgi:drug/metabolite transporter (DMT)-like permease
MLTSMRRRGELWPTLALTAAALVAGSNWIALRYLQALGLESAWSSLAFSGLATLALLPFARWKGFRLDAALLALFLTGLANGGAIALYTASMLLTDVVRTLVLFYLAPMWGALLGIVLLGERLSAARLLAVLLCLGGMLTILGIGHGWPWPRNIGDWLAILSGLAYAYGSVRVYKAKAVGAAAQTLSTMIGSTLASVVVLLLLPEAARGAPPPAAAFLWFLAAVYAVGMILPINWAALWAAKFLPPARVGLIFSIESVIGITTAALLLDEPFGWREAVGSVLVIASTVVDVLGHQPVPAPGLIPANPTEETGT